MNYFRARVKNDKIPYIFTPSYKNNICVLDAGVRMPVKEPNNCSYMFENNEFINDPIYIGNTVTDCSYMFSNCQNFNNIIFMGDNVTNCSYMFNSCNNFNQSIQIPNNVINCSHMFDSCENFNQNIQIPNNVTDCSYMFNWCTELNQNIQIPNSVTNCSYMFSSSILKDIITIPSSVTDCSFMFSNCQLLSEIIIQEDENQPIHNFTGLIYNRPNNISLRIHCNNLSLITDSSSNSIVNEPIMWSSMTNGYYNLFYNVFLYNNI